MMVLLIFQIPLRLALLTVQQLLQGMVLNKNINLLLKLPLGVGSFFRSKIFTSRDGLIWYVSQVPAARRFFENKLRQNKLRQLPLLIYGKQSKPFFSDLPAVFGQIKYSYFPIYHHLRSFVNTNRAFRASPMQQSAPFLSLIIQNQKWKCFPEYALDCWSRE